MSTAPPCSAPVARCPDCDAPITGEPACAACGLPLTGPTAGRLWQVDQRLAALDGERDRLLADRARLLELLRGGEPAPATAPPDPWASAAPPNARAHRPEASPRSVQNTLLGLGALLLAIAGIVFTAVTYRHLGVGGRALVLMGLTAAAAAAPVWLRDRDLTSSAEAVATVAVVLAALDAWALRRAGFVGTVDGRSYAAGTAALLAAGTATYASVVPLRAARFASALLAQVPLPLVLARTDASLPAAAVALAAQAAGDLVLGTRTRLPRDVRRLAAGLGALTALAALAVSLVAVADDDRGGAAGLLALAVLLAVASAQVRDRFGTALLSGASVLLLTGAAWALAQPRLTDPQQPLVPAAAALLALQATALLPAHRREGPVLGALVAAGVALLAGAGAVLEALVGPFAWLGRAWTLTAGGARAALLPDLRWSGTVVTLVVLATAAGCVVSAGAVLDRLPDAVVPAVVLGAASAVVLPLGLATGYHAALALLLVAGAVLGTAGVVLLDRSRPLALGLVAAGAAVVLLAAAWSTAEETATLAVLPVAAVLLAALAVVLPGLPTAGAALLAGGAVASYGASGGLAVEQVGALLVAAPTACLGASALLRGAHRLALEAAAGVLAATAVVLAARDPGWLSWTLAATGVLALALALRGDRRPAAVAGGLLLAASSWVRLADAGVHAPEPYVGPLAVAALVVGWLRRRSQPELASFAAYGAGLSLALVPSLLRSFGDESPTRALVLLVVAVGVVVTGGRSRLRAPLVIGGLVVVADAVHLLAPYAAALPRWVLLATVGLVLVLLGATYEQRLRDAGRLRERYASWV